MSKDNEKLFAKAEDLTNGQTGYVNGVRLAVNQIEVVVSLYLVQPGAGDTLQAQQVYKFIMPRVVAEDFAGMLERALVDREVNDEPTAEGGDDEH